MASLVSGTSDWPGNYFCVGAYKLYVASRSHELYMEYKEVIQGLPNNKILRSLPIMLCHGHIRHNYLGRLEQNLSVPGTSRRYTVELQWLEHLWNHENIFETGVVRANESLS